MDPLNPIPKRARVAVASGDDLDVRTFAVKQHMNELSRIELRVTSANLSVALDDVIGKDATFTVTSNRESLVYTGVCMEMEQVRVDRENLATYTLVIAPRLWLTTHRKNYRIFQFLSELDIVRQLLDEWGIEHEVRCEREYKPRKFRVQYDETDFVFICRMLEDAGISFHFQAGGGGTTMILDDEPEAREVGHPALAYHDEPGVLDSPFVTRVSVLQAVRPGRITIGDLDYRRPSTAQPRLSAARGLAQESRLEQFDYEPGVFLYGAEGGGDTPTADDRGASRTDEGVGGEKTLDRLLSRRQGEKVVRLESNVLELSPGSIFGVENHPHRALASGATQLVIGSLLEGDHDGDWRTHVSRRSRVSPALRARPWSAPQAKRSIATNTGVFASTSTGIARATEARPARVGCRSASPGRARRSAASTSRASDRRSSSSSSAPILTVLSSSAGSIPSSTLPRTSCPNTRWFPAS
jgi:type VI secretion system secreted protein VgrG